MKKLTVFFYVLIVSITHAQTDKGIAYINTYKNIAMKEMIRTGVPAAITLAQGILESSYGESDLCKQSNNHFGIKCKNEWTGDKVYHDDDTKNECFRSYPNAEASFRDHSDFLKNRPYYTNLFKLDPTDFEGWAYGLKKDGYATEKDYPQKLLQIINDYNLNQYTLLALQNKRNGSPLAVGKDANTTNPAKVIPVIETAKQPVTSAATREDEQTGRTTPAPTDKTTSPQQPANSYPEGVFTINHTKAVYAEKGTSLLSLADQYDISLSRLLEYNEMDDRDILEAGQLIFLEKKMKKGSKDFHVVELNETIHEICQREGVRMENVLAYNSLKKNMQPLPGEKIYLRSAAPATPKFTTIAAINSNTSSR